MGIAGSIVVFLILWWLCFLASLSFGLERNGDGEGAVAGTDRGAPDKPRLILKAGIATGLAAALYGVIQLLVLTGIIAIPGVN